MLTATTRPHVPQRPMWLCRACSHPWPCGRAKLTLTRSYALDPVGLSIYLCAQLHEAATDLYAISPFDTPDPATLFTRFIGWALPRRHT